MAINVDHFVRTRPELIASLKSMEGRLLADIAAAHKVSEQCANRWLVALGISWERRRPSGGNAGKSESAISRNLSTTPAGIAYINKRAAIAKQRRDFIVSKLGTVGGFRMRDAIANDIPPSIVRRILIDLSKAGKCHMAASGKNKVAYFDCAVRSMQWFDANRPKTQYAPVSVSSRIADARKADFSRAKVTIAPRPLGRYELAPGERVAGGFATAGIGRYLDGMAA